MSIFLSNPIFAFDLIKLRDFWGKNTPAMKTRIAVFAQSDEQKKYLEEKNRWYKDEFDAWGITNCY